MISKIFYSSLIVTIVLIYILKLPNLITNADKLIKEYYYDDFFKSLILDLILYQLYIHAGKYFINYFKIKNLISKLTVISGVTMVISTIFMCLFLKFASKDIFFYRWFNQVGFLAVIYDIIIVSSVYLLSEYL